MLIYFYCCKLASRVSLSVPILSNQRTVLNIRKFMETPMFWPKIIVTFDQKPVWARSDWVKRKGALIGQ